MYTWYVSSIYGLLGDDMLCTTFYKKHQNPFALICRLYIPCCTQLTSFVLGLPSILRAKSFNIWVSRFYFCLVYIDVNPSVRQPFSIGKIHLDSPLHLLYQRAEKYAGWVTGMIS